jgi:acyl carrier protein
MTEAADDLPAQIIEVFRAQFKNYSGPVHRGLSADQVPGWDSLSHAEFIMSIEDRLGLRLDPGAAFEYRNLGDLADDVARLAS